MKTKMPTRKSVGRRKVERPDPDAPAARRLELDQPRREISRLDAVVLQHREQIGVFRNRRHRVATSGLLGVLDQDVPTGVLLHQFLHLAVANLLRDLADAPRGWRVVVPDERRPHGEDRDDEHDPHQATANPTLFRHATISGAASNRSCCS